MRTRRVQGCGAERTLPAPRPLSLALPGLPAGAGVQRREHPPSHPPLPRPQPAAPPGCPGPVRRPGRGPPASGTGGEGPGLQSQTAAIEMASVRIREAEEGDCGHILRLIRVTPAGRNRGPPRGCGRRGLGLGRGERGVWAAGGRGPLPLAGLCPRCPRNWPSTRNSRTR